MAHGSGEQGDPIEVGFSLFFKWPQKMQLFAQLIQGDANKEQCEKRMQETWMLPSEMALSRLFRLPGCSMETFQNREPQLVDLPPAPMGQAS